MKRSPTHVRRSTRPKLPIERNVEATRPTSRGGTLHGGDRRDTNRQFTTTNRHQPNFGDPLGSGKKQKQSGGKGRKNASRRRK
jgi:hypothetical protein